MSKSSRLAQATAGILLLAFLVLLAVHITSIITNAPFFPIPEAFFLLFFVALFLGIMPTAFHKIPLSEYFRRYLGPFHPFVRWLPLGILLYSAVIYIFLSQITAGEPLTKLTPAARSDAEYLQGLCIQSFLMAIILFGGLVAWSRSTRRSD